MDKQQKNKQIDCDHMDNVASKGQIQRHCDAHWLLQEELRQAVGSAPSETATVMFLSPSIQRLGSSQQWLSFCTWEANALRTF